MSKQRDSSTEQTTRHGAAQRGSEGLGLRLYMLAVTLAGAVVIISFLPAAVAEADAVFLTLCALTAAAGPLAIRFRLPGRTAGGLAVTVSDCFTFLGLALLGPAAAVTLGALDGLAGTFGMLIRKPSRCLFNIGQVSVAIFAASQVYSAWGPSTAPSDSLSSLASTALSLAICAGIYFAFSDALVAAAIGMSSQQPVGALFAKLAGKLLPAFALITAAAVAATASTPQIAALVAAVVLLAVAAHLLKRIDDLGD